MHELRLLLRRYLVGAWRHRWIAIGVAWLAVPGRLGRDVVRARTCMRPTPGCTWMPTRC